MDRQKAMESFGRLLDIMDELRVKCPWDRVQTIQTLRPQSIEEVYELSEAIVNEDYKEMRKELGDVLLQVVFYAKIGDEKGEFDIDDVINFVCNKLVYRHPHVFGDVHVNDAAEVLKNWEQLKTKEKGGNKTVLSGVPNSLPSLIKAFRIQDKAHAVGFDWDKKEQIWDKVEEEKQEFLNEVESGDADKIEAEFGDLLFTLVNIARRYNVNPENALERTNNKFIKRFGYVEAKAKEQGRTVKELSMEEMEQLWQEAKKAL